MKAKTLGEDITEGERLYSLIKELRAAGYTKPIESASVEFMTSTPVSKPGTIVMTYTTNDDSIEGIYAGFDSTIGAHAVIYVSLVKATGDKKSDSNNRRLEYTTLIATYSKPDEKEKVDKKDL